MKSQFKSSTVPSSRCSHRSATGRQCRQLSADSQSQLCVHHLDEQKQKEVNDLSRTLLARSQNFQTAQGVNFALANIYRLLAANRISPRRASVLAYINSLLLRTLPAIDYDHATGHKDPTVPQNEANEEGQTEAENEIESDSSIMHAEEPSENAAPTNTLSKATQGWTTSIPEPDVEAKSDSPKTNAKHSIASPSNASSTNNPAPPYPYRSYWATIPDPTKKPS